MYQMSPKNDRTLVVDLGLGQLTTVLIFDGSASIPCAKIIWPKNWRDVQKSSVFLGKQNIKCMQRASRIFLTLQMCSRIQFDQMIMSSR